VFQNKIDRFSSLSVHRTCNNIQYTNTYYLCAIAQKDNVFLFEIMSDLPLPM